MQVEFTKIEGRSTSFYLAAAVLAALGIVVWLCNPATIWRGLNGLETGLVVMIMLLVLLEYFA